MANEMQTPVYRTAASQNGFPMEVVAALLVLGGLIYMGDWNKHAGRARPIGPAAVRPERPVSRSAPGRGSRPTGGSATRP